MATGFKYVPYTTDAGTVGQIRLSSQAQTATGQGLLTAAITDSKLFAFAQNPGSARKKQLNARGVKLTRPVGTAPNVFQRTTFLPIVTATALAAIAVGSTITIGGNAYTVARKISEA